MTDATNENSNEQSLKVRKQSETQLQKNKSRLVYLLSNQFIATLSSLNTNFFQKLADYAYNSSCVAMSEIRLDNDTTPFKLDTDVIGDKSGVSHYLNLFVVQINGGEYTIIDRDKICDHVKENFDLKQKYVLYKRDFKSWDLSGLSNNLLKYSKVTGKLRNFVDTLFWVNGTQLVEPLAKNIEFAYDKADQMLKDICARRKMLNKKRTIGMRQCEGSRDKNWNCLFGCLQTFRLNNRSIKESVHESLLVIGSLKMHDLNLNCQIKTNDGRYVEEDFEQGEEAVLYQKWTDRSIHFAVDQHKRYMKLLKAQPDGTDMLTWSHEPYDMVIQDENVPVALLTNKNHRHYYGDWCSQKTIVNLHNHLENKRLSWVIVKRQDGDTHLNHLIGEDKNFKDVTLLTNIIRLFTHNFMVEHGRVLIPFHLGILKMLYACEEIFVSAGIVVVFDSLCHNITYETNCTNNPHIPISKANLLSTLQLALPSIKKKEIIIKFWQDTEDEKVDSLKWINLQRNESLTEHEKKDSSVSWIPGSDGDHIGDDENQGSDGDHIGDDENQGKDDESTHTLVQVITDYKRKTF